ncbi:DUF2644 domain-containing protein [[Haemophilus] ducreyi]|uniref:DUF2644 domain-containing protein n=1 Tax=Haemophilus ducreyi TaxID=730 RepID=UPI000B1798FF|nr:DUF2644 domain-containing protein [[Haemophilus] ducreyi]
MWKPTKGEYDRAEKLLQVYCISDQERETLHEIKYAYENPVELDWLQRAVLMALEQKYDGQKEVMLFCVWMDKSYVPELFSTFLFACVGTAATKGAVNAFQRSRNSNTEEE